MKKQLTAEFLGTYFIVLAGTGAIVINKLTGELTHVGVSLTFGLVVAALIFAFGHISGAHFNPAVTIGFLLLRKIDFKCALNYIIVQCIGAVLASITIRYLFGNVENLGATLPRGSTQQALLFEFILTFLLVMVIFSSATHKKANASFAAIAIGATVGLEAMFGGPITGASMNPARSLAPAIVSGHVSSLWIYLVATVLGAIAATYVYKIIQE